MSSGLPQGENVRLTSCYLIPIFGLTTAGYLGIFIGTALGCLLQVVYLVYSVQKETHEPDYQDVLKSIGLTLFYPGIFGLSLIALTKYHSPQDCLMLIVAVASADIFAYFGGRAIGGAKLASRISPNKTISGAVVGICAASLSVYLFKYFITWQDYSEISFLIQLQAILLGAIIGGASIFGDLVASLCKRSFEVKDSGSILPGHGGVLDRIDGLLAAAPILLWTLSL